MLSISIVEECVNNVHSNGVADLGLHRSQSFSPSKLYKTKRVKTSA